MLTLLYCTIRQLPIHILIHKNETISYPFAYPSLPPASQNKLLP